MTLPWMRSLPKAACWIENGRLFQAGRLLFLHQLLPDRLGRPRLIQGIEMQPGRAAGQQALAQIGHDLETESPDRFAVVAEAGEFQAYPARNLGAAHVRKAH